MVFSINTIRWSTQVHSQHKHTYQMVTTKAHISDTVLSFSLLFPVQASTDFNINIHQAYIISNAVSWHTGGSIDKGSDSMRITWRVTIAELDSWAPITKMGTVFMETADRPCKACIPAVTLRHCLSHCVYPLSIGECLII